MPKPPENSRRCCCARRERGSKAAPTRSCATSSPSACCACPAISGSTRKFRSTRYRPGEEDKTRPHPEEPRDARRLEGWASWFETAQARLLTMRGKAEITFQAQTDSAMNFDDTPQD